MAAICMRMPLVLSFVMLAGSIPLAAQTQFASLTGKIASTDRSKDGRTIRRLRVASF